MEAGFLGYGVYIPRYRIKREEYTKVWGYFMAPGISEKAVAGFDEDVTTMAVESSRNALRSAGVKPAVLNAIYFGTSSPTYADKLTSSTVASALGASTNVALVDFGASEKAGTAALLSCLDFIESGRGEYGLVVVSDSPLGRPTDDVEHPLGAGAASYVIGRGKVVTRFEGAYSMGYEMWGGKLRRGGEKFVEELGVTRFREMEYDQVVESSAKGLMDKLNIKPEQITYAVFQQPDSRSPFRVGRALGLKDPQIAQSIIASNLGDIGASSVLVGLAAVLDSAKPGDRILVTSYGSGAGGDAFSLIVQKEIETLRGKIPSLESCLKNKVYVDYITYLRWRRLLPSRMLTM